MVTHPGLPSLRISVFPGHHNVSVNLYKMPAQVLKLVLNTDKHSCSARPSLHLSPDSGSRSDYHTAGESVGHGPGDAFHARCTACALSKILSRKPELRPLLEGQEHSRSPFGLSRDNADKRFVVYTLTVVDTMIDCAASHR